MTRPHTSASAGAELVGPLLARLRNGRGWSQLRLADTLCQVTGRITVTRHEVSRWERGVRLPGPFWLDALAVVLQTPRRELDTALHATRQRIPGPGARPAGRPWLWRPPAAPDLLAALDHHPLDDLPDLAHAWLTGPPYAGRGATCAYQVEPEPEPVLRDGTGRDVLGLLKARLGRLRHADDPARRDGAGRAGRPPATAGDPGAEQGRQRPGTVRTRALRLIAGYVQLAGWVEADAEDGMAARRAYRVGLKAATIAADRDLAAHVLGSLSSLSLDGGNPHQALLAARTGLAGLPSLPTEPEPSKGTAARCCGRCCCTGRHWPQPAATSGARPNRCW